MQVAPNQSTRARTVTQAADAVMAGRSYNALLHRMRQRGILGKVAIYPAIGIDVLPARHAKVVGLNLYPYTIRAALAQLFPIIDHFDLARLANSLRTNLKSISRIDLSWVETCKKALEPYRSVSPKSLMIKGLIDSAFAKEYDIDTERYYEVPATEALARAQAWAKEMTKWLNISDTLIVFERELFGFFSNHPDLTEIDLGLHDRGPEHDFIYIRQVPIIYLPHYAKIFRKVETTCLKID